MTRLSLAVLTLTMLACAMQPAAIHALPVITSGFVTDDYHARHRNDANSVFMDAAERRTREVWTP